MHGEMRQNIVRMQTQRAAEATTQALINKNHSTSIDVDPSHSNPMKSRPDSYTRAEIDQIVEAIYKTLGAPEERLDRRCDDIYFPWDITFSSLRMESSSFENGVLQVSV